ncbi:MAG: ABC transporter permease [Pseudomonadales bacterium]|jgi:ABC-2 type transport system permease protein|nr:ABC transporter permease [Pseudomonadales bacterium]
MNQTLLMTRTFARIFSRDRQALFFSLFFPLIFMSVFGLVGRSGNAPLMLGISDTAHNALSAEFIAVLQANPLFTLQQGEEASLREHLVSGDLKLLLVIPADFHDASSSSELRVIADTAQVRELGLIMPALQQALVDVERKLRGVEPLFTLKVEDIQARAQNYLAFLVPGMLAFAVMQISIAGSGYNIVEYRRKGILKRLFVTPLEPSSFIGGLVLSRALLCLIQLSVLLLYALLVLKVPLAGRLWALYLVVALGTAMFLSLGFCLGSIAKTQATIMALGNLVTFPQMFLSGIFYPIDILPHFVQPLAQLLPLSFLANALRGIIVDGATLLTLWPSLLGLGVWSAIFLLLSVRLFVWKEVAA